MLIPKPPKKVRKISIGLYHTYSFSSSANEIEKIMRKHGFDDPTSCWFFCEGSISHPKSTQIPILNYALEVDYYLKPSIAIGMSAGFSGWTETNGYSDDHSYLFIKQQQFRVAPYVRFYEPGNHLTFVIGPSINFLGYFRSDAGPETNRDRNINPRPGLLAQAGISLLERNYMSLKLVGRYNFTYGASIGPYKPDVYGGDPDGAPIVVPKTQFHVHEFGAGINFALKFGEFFELICFDRKRWRNILQNSSYFACIR